MLGSGSGNAPEPDGRGLPGGLMDGDGDGVGVGVGDGDGQGWDPRTFHE